MCLQVQVVGVGEVAMSVHVSDAYERDQRREGMD